MTIATVITNVANEAGYTVESNILTSNETTTKQLLAIANRINRDIFEAYPWPKCYASGSITLVANTATYELPPVWRPLRQLPAAQEHSTARPEPRWLAVVRLCQTRQSGLVPAPWHQHPPLKKRQEHSSAYLSS